MPQIGSTANGEPSTANLSDMFEKEIGQLFVHPLAAVAVAGADSVGGAVLEMVAQEDLGHGAQRLLDRGELDERVGAVALLFDHPLDTADLSFDAAEAGHSALLEGGVDAVCVAWLGHPRQYTPMGYLAVRLIFGLHPLPMDPQELFLSNLDAIDRAISYVCHRNHLSPQDAEEFNSEVKTKLIEANYAVLRKFEGRSSFSTYMTTVIQRLYFQWRV